MIQLRKKLPVFADVSPPIIRPSSNPHIFVFERTNGKDRVWVISNFDENTQFLHVSWLFTIGIHPENNLKDGITGKKLKLERNLLQLRAYEHLWIMEG